MNLPYGKKTIKMATFFIILASGISFILGSSDLRGQNELTKVQENVQNYEIQKDKFSFKNEEKTDENQIMGNFTIKEYNGNVAVFESGKVLPIETTETMVDDLPAADRELLKKGIIVSSKKELSRILEDYCS